MVRLLEVLKKLIGIVLYMIMAFVVAGMIVALEIYISKTVGNMVH